MLKIQQLHSTWASPYRDMGYYIFTISTCPSSQFRHCSSVLSKIHVVFYVWGIWGIWVSRLPRTTTDNHVSTSLFFFLKVNPWKTSGPLLTENLSPKRSVVIGVHPILSVGIRPLIQMSIEILSCHVRNIKHDEGVNLSE